jgi:hypothetical protein
MDHRHPCDCSTCKSLHRIAVALEEFVDFVVHRPRYAKLHFKGDHNMPATIQVGKTATAVFTEFDAQGNKVPPLGTVGFTSSAPPVATVDANGICTGVSAGSATIVGLDDKDQMTASDVLTVTDPAASATLVLTAN